MGLFKTEAIIQNTNFDFDRIFETIEKKYRPEGFRFQKKQVGVTQVLEIRKGNFLQGIVGLNIELDVFFETKDDDVHITIKVLFWQMIITMLIVSIIFLPFLIFDFIQLSKQSTFADKLIYLIEQSQ